MRGVGVRWGSREGGMGRRRRGEGRICRRRRSLWWMGGEGGERGVGVLLGFGVGINGTARNFLGGKRRYKL